MSISFLGDLHGNMPALVGIMDEIYKIDDIKCLIQVGDFGTSMRYMKEAERIQYNFQKPVYIIEGNHEYFSEWEITEVTEMLPNLFFVPRGEVLYLDGRKVAFLGGAASIDKKRQLADRAWDERENITTQQAAILRKNIMKDMINPVDIFVTHTPPKSVIDKNFNPMHKLMFDVSIDWFDPGSVIIDTLWAEMNYPMNVSGHFHKRVSGPNYRILDIAEFWIY